MPAMKRLATRVVSLAAVFSLVGCVHRKKDSLPWLQGTLTPIALPADSVVLKRLSREHPCVIRVPRLSRMSDSLSTATTCTLVATAVDAIQNLSAADPEVLPSLRQFRIERVLCATLRQEAYRNDMTGAIELPRWSVEFTSDEQPGVAVEINRLTGETRAFNVPKEFDFTAIDVCG